MPIYTKKGDKGNSSIGKPGKDLSKNSLIFDVLGNLDELTSSLGFLHNSKTFEIKKLSILIQKDLFYLGTLLVENKQKNKENWDLKTKVLENYIDKLDKHLPKLSHFILPGGSLDSAYLHFCRVVCRRMERSFIHYKLVSKRKDLDSAGTYLNRLSDLLFIAARYVNKKKRIKEITWTSSK